MKTSLCQSLFGCIYPSLFHVVGRSLLGPSHEIIFLTISRYYLVNWLDKIQIHGYIHYPDIKNY